MDSKFDIGSDWVDDKEWEELAWNLLDQMERDENQGNNNNNNNKKKENSDGKRRNENDKTKGNKDKKVDVKVEK